MPECQKCDRLAVKITKVLKKGISADEKTTHFIESTFSDPTMPQILEFIADRESWEARALLDLFFFPDERFQCRLEPILEADVFTDDHKQKIVRRLETDPPETHIRFPRSGETLPLVMPPVIAAQFVARLHITRQPDQQLRKVITGRFEEPRQSLFKVKLRNARFAYTTNVKNFLRDFADKVSPNHDQLLDMVDFSVELLVDVGPQDDIFTVLTDRKKAYFRGLQAAAKFQRQLSESNMETLMLTGVRLPTMGIEEAREQMALIDTISQAVFGKTAYFHARQHGMDLVGDDTGMDARRALDLLS